VFTSGGVSYKTFYNCNVNDNAMENSKFWHQSQKSLGIVASIIMLRCTWW
jgi:hypothetical protein